MWAAQERLLDKAGQLMPVEDRYIAATARWYGLKVSNDRPRPCVVRTVVTERRVDATAVGIPEQHRDPIAVRLRVADSLRAECERRSVVQSQDGILNLLRVPDDIDPRLVFRSAGGILLARHLVDPAGTLA